MMWCYRHLLVVRSCYISSVVHGAEGSGDGGYELIKSDDNAVLAESRMVIIERY
jgi:hypothetical protein